MKIEALLDTPVILANQAAPVHLLVRFTAPATAGGRDRPIAFTAVLDRSGSMAGVPLLSAREAAKVAVKNLRRDDLFGLVVFDNEAQVVVPLQKAAGKQSIGARIDSIEQGGSTNLTAGWMLGRDELLKAGDTIPKRLLLLTDGQLNCGIIEPAMVRQIVASGLEKGGIRTSCLGFGPGYDEHLLADLSGATNGIFYDANSAEKLPGIFAAELEGLQALAIQNLRLRIRKLDFCDALALLADYPIVQLPDGRIEIAVGDLVSEEDRTLVALLKVLPIPLLADGKPAASLEGEALLELEAAFDAITPEGVTSQTWKQTLRVLSVQDPAEVRINGEVIPWVAQQRAGRAVEGALREANAGRVDQARKLLRDELHGLEPMGTSPAAAEARRFIQETLDRLERDGSFTVRESKARLYSSRTRRRMSSSQHWTGDAPAPDFIKPRPDSPKPNPPQASPPDPNPPASDSSPGAPDGCNLK